MLEEVIEQSLKVRTVERMERFLDELPTTVYGAYEHILEQSPERDDARKLLQIVLAAVRPLTLQEMNIALNISEGDNSIDDLDLMRDEAFKTYVRNICGLFVGIYDSRIYLLHQTAKEFLLSREDISQVVDQGNPRKEIWKHSMEMETCNLLLARICLYYLSFSVFEDQPPPPKEVTQSYLTVLQEYGKHHEFLEYASIYWTRHFQMARADDKIMYWWAYVCNTQSQRFFTWFSWYWELQQDKQNLWYYGIDRGDLPAGFTAFMVASFFGHDVMVERLSGEGILMSKDSMQRTTLWWAVYSGHGSTVRLLLDRGAAQLKDRNGNAPLIVAATKGHLDLVGEMVARSAPIDCTNVNGQTPLLLAITYGHTEIARFLVAKGAMIAFEDKEGRTPLFHAASRGNEEIVELLLNKGVAADSFDKYGWSPLSHAVAEGGNEEIIKLLLAKGAVADSLDKKGQSPLSYAAASWRENEEIVKLLLENGAAVDSKDNQGYSPLFNAAGFCCGALADLLTNEVNRDFMMKYNESPLVLPSSPRPQVAIKYLLELAASPESSLEFLFYAFYEEDIRRGLVTVKTLIEHDAEPTMAGCQFEKSLEDIESEEDDVSEDDEVEEDDVSADEDLGEDYFCRSKYENQAHKTTKTKAGSADSRSYNRKIARFLYIIQHPEIVRATGIDINSSSFSS